MIKWVCAAALVMGAAPARAEAPIEVLVLGSYHFGNPGLDINNLKADSVLTPKRQDELDRVARALAAFKPTRVMVERQSEAPGFAVADYAGFDEARLGKDADETVQIAYRTARLAGVKVINGIDEQPKDGEPDYFPFSKLQAAAAKAGQTAALEAANAPVAAAAKAFEAAQTTKSVGELLVQFNDPKSATSNMDSYYSVLGMGDADDQAGADLNAMWYLRNAKIFGKLMQVAKPGDRVLVVYGAGHGFWLRHFASLTPGYRNVDVRPYLARAK